MTIQNIRFPGKFCYDINVPPEFLQMNLPVFLFQPLVENSVECLRNNQKLFSVPAKLLQKGITLLDLQM